MTPEQKYYKVMHEQVCQITEKMLDFARIDSKITLRQIDITRLTAEKMICEILDEEDLVTILKRRTQLEAEIYQAFNICLGDGYDAGKLYPVIWQAMDAVRRILDLMMEYDKEGGKNGTARAE